MAHQTRGVSFLLKQDLAILLFDRGTGKTPTVLSELDYRIKTGNVKRALYVAPLSTLENIKREAFRFATHLFPVVLTGTRKDRIAKLMNAGANLFIINFEGVRLLCPQLAAIEFEYIICDESTRIKDRSTQTARAMNIVSRVARHKRCLTGMPFTEGVQDAWSQFNWLSPRILGDNFWVFRSRYCVLETGHVWDHSKQKARKYKKIIGSRNLPEFEAKIMPYIMRVAKEDCVDLPPKVFQIRKIPMSVKQRKKYVEVEKSIASEIDGETVQHAMALTKLQKLRQVAAGFMYVDKPDGEDRVKREAKRIDCPKYAEIVQELSDTLYGLKKAVLFTTFIAEPAIMEEWIKKKAPHIRVFHLPRKPEDRQSEIDKWTKWDSGPAVLIANMRSGGTGLNLNVADWAVYVSNDWRMEDRAQSEDRIHRIGSERFQKVTYTDYVMEDSVEEDVLEALKQKKSLVETFLERIRKKQKGKEKPEDE